MTLTNNFTAVTDTSTSIDEYSEPIRLIVKRIGEKLGDRLAQIVSQIHYWTHQTDSGEYHLGFKWIYNRLKDWQRQFPWLSYWQIQRYLAQLRKLGIVVVSNFNDTPWYRRYWYRLNYQRLEELTGWKPAWLPMLHECNFEVAPVQLDHIKHIAPQQQQAATEKEKSECSQEETSDLPVGGMNNPEADAINDKLSRADLFSAELLNISLQFSLKEIEQAIALCDSRESQKKVKNRRGLFRSCLQGQWWREEPNRQPSAVIAELPPEVEEWYQLAKQKGAICDRYSSVGELPRGSGVPWVTLSKRHYQQLSGRYEEIGMSIMDAMQTFPLAWLEHQ